MDVKKTSIPDFTRLDLFLPTANWLQARYLSIPPYLFSLSWKTINFFKSSKMHFAAKQ